MASKVTCTCGWSWNKSDSSKKDMYICHQCGKDNTMKNGGWLDKFQEGREKKPITTREDFEPGILSNIPGLTSIASGNQPGYNRQEQYGPLGDLYRYYGGQPLKYKVLVESQNKPSTSKDKNAKYISLNHDQEFVNEVLDNYKRVSSGKLDKGIESKLSDNSWSVSGYSSAGKNAHKTKKQGSEHHSNAIGRYTLGKGKDEKGEYISYYDNFDQGTGTGINPGELLGLTKPFEIYDRIYLDPKTGKPKMKNGGWLSKYNSPEAQNGIEGTMAGLTDKGFNYNGAWGGTMQTGGKTFLEPTSEKLPLGYMPPSIIPSSEVAISIGGVGDEPAYLIPSFKYGQRLKDPIGEFDRTGEHLGGPFKTYQEADEWERTVRHPYVEKGQSIPSPYRRWGKDYDMGKGEFMQMGGSIPGSVGFTYARTQDPAPSNGPYAKKTKASAQDGKKISYNQWKKQNNLKETSDYNLKRAWELGYTPDKTGHLPTVDNQTGKFLKAKGHPTLNLELDWYNSPEGAEFKSKNTLDSTGKFFKYVPKLQNGQEMKFYQEGLDWKPKTISRDGGWLGKYEEGGIIEDDLGQWEYPGEITKINSNEITMQGVDYPVLGISDTGDTQMMQPGQDYSYEGESVTEIPMAQNGYSEPDYVTGTTRRSMNKMIGMGNYLMPASALNTAADLAKSKGLDYGEKTSGPADAVRHTAAAASVASKLPIPKFIGDYSPNLERALRIAGANILGGGYELMNPNNEGLLMDIKNNYQGSLIGSIPGLNESDRNKMIVNQLQKGKLTVDNPKKPKKENGGWLSKYN